MNISFLSVKMSLLSVKAHFFFCLCYALGRNLWEKPHDFWTTAENILNREFETGGFGQKWLTDVTEMIRYNKLRKLNKG